LTPSQKAITRHQIEEVDYINNHGKSDTKILLGRQLFIAKEMRSLATTQKQLLLPYEFCIMLVDEEFNALDGNLKLSYREDEEWIACEKEQIDLGSWLFSKVPAEKEAYRPYGEAEGYIDPELEELQFMSVEDLIAHHYHILTIPFTQYCNAERGGPIGDWLVSGQRRSQLFQPVTPFQIRAIVVYLQAYPYPIQPPPSFGFLSIHNTYTDGTPIDPPITYGTFSVNLAEFPTFKAHVAFVSPLVLDNYTRYAWVVGFPPPYRPESYIRVEGGWHGCCNFDPQRGNAESQWTGEEWSPWVLNEIPFCAYELKGLPP